MRKIAIIVALLIIYLSDVPGLMVSDITTWFNKPTYTDWSILKELRTGGVFYEPWYDYHYLEFYLHKIGHVFFYGLLTFCVFWKTSNIKTFLIKFILIFLFAISDEIHQLFVIGRSGRLMDVFVDLSSVLLILIVMKLTRCLWGNENKNCQI